MGLMVLMFFSFFMVLMVPKKTYIIIIAAIRNLLNIRIEQCLVFLFSCWVL